MGNNNGYGSKILKEIHFHYGQWDVSIDIKVFDWNNVETLYAAVDATGDWRATQGMLYDSSRTCCAYDEPELLPKGLKRRIYEKAHDALLKLEVVA